MVWKRFEFVEEKTNFMTYVIQICGPLQNGKGSAWVFVLLRSKWDVELERRWRTHQTLFLNFLRYLMASTCTQQGGIARLLLLLWLQKLEFNVYK